MAEEKGRQAALLRQRMAGRHHVPSAHRRNRWPLVLGVKSKSPAPCQYGASLSESLFRFGGLRRDLEPRSLCAEHLYGDVERNRAVNLYLYLAEARSLCRNL